MTTPATAYGPEVLARLVALTTLNASSSLALAYFERIRQEQTTSSPSFTKGETK